MKEIFKPVPDEPADPGRVFYTITPEDVGKVVIITTIGAIHASGIMGRVQAGDVGKRLYRVPVSSGITGQPVAWIWQAENDRQRNTRLAMPPLREISAPHGERPALTRLERAMIPPRGCGSHHAGECTSEPPYTTG